MKNGAWKLYTLKTNEEFTAIECNNLVASDGSAGRDCIYKTTSSWDADFIMQSLDM